MTCGYTETGSVNTTIPIRVLAATESHDVAFRQVHLADLGRVRTRNVYELNGRELSQDEIDKGYETGHYVIALTDTELASLPLPTARATEIEAFIDADTIDPPQMSTGYYRATDGPVAAKPYVLLRKALQRSSKIAIAKFAFHRRERLGMLRVLDNIIVLQSLRWDDEIRAPAAIAPPPSSLTDDEIKAGIELLETLAQDDVRNLSDHYREALEEVLIAKTLRRSRPVPGRRRPGRGPAAAPHPLPSHRPARSG
ncbi:Ku protein [Streptomyces violascens]|uniref:non-homologous end joining protein Ku n=1 Tax=Streptomyces violascens TaxID=67381 RepID=UPI0036C1FA6F